MTQVEPARASLTIYLTGLQLEQVGPATVVSIGQPSLLDEDTVNGIADHLNDLVLSWDCRSLVLCLDAVKRMSSGMLGKILALHKKLQRLDGRLLLCGLNPGIAEVLRVLHLDQLLNVFATEEEAVQSLQ
jgi:anti-anti-sigma factor